LNLTTTTAAMISSCIFLCNSNVSGTIIWGKSGFILGAELGAPTVHLEWSRIGSYNT